MKNRNILERVLSQVEISTEVKGEINAFLKTKSKNVKWFADWKEDVQEKLVQRYQSKFNKEIQELVYNFIEKSPIRQNDSKLQSFKSSDQILNAITTKNTAISAAFGMIPPPFSYFVVVPELVFVLNNQLKMLTEIGYSVGNEERVNKDSVFGLFASSISKTSKKLVFEDGANYIVSRVNKEVTPHVCQYISNTLLSQLSSSVVSKFVPALGSVFFTAWVRYQTASMGKRAVEVYSKKIIFQPLSEQWDQHIHPTTQKQYSEEEKVGETIKLFINLMNLDGVQHKRELSHILDLITNASLSHTTKENLLESLLSKENLEINYTILNSLEYKSVLILDLFAFANIDEHRCEKELIFIREVAETLNKTSVLELLEAN